MFNLIIPHFTAKFNNFLELIQRSCNFFNNIILDPVVTDMGTELSVPTDMITPTKAFSVLTEYQILAIDGVGRGIWV